MKEYLNLGCGNRLNPAWVNVDFKACREGVVEHDLREGIPYPDGSFAAGYHSHVFEHFTRADAARFLKECHRVLAPGGILRVVVPDLEKIARDYVATLDQAGREDRDELLHEWLILELYDQTVRTQSGGQVIDFLRRHGEAAAGIIAKRWGGESLLAFRRSVDEGTPSSPKKRGMVPRILRALLRPASYRELLLRILLGDEYPLLREARFRHSGEIHRWMYDRFSLARLLESCGFVQVTMMTATTSAIPDWAGQGLDTNADGSIYKPDSLFMEAVRP